MFLKLKSPVEDNDTDVNDLENGQLYVDDDGDICLVVQESGDDENNKVICFHSYVAIIMNDPPPVVRLVTYDDVEGL